MLFNSYTFIAIFLPIVLSGFYLINQRSRPGALIWLSLASVFFYGHWNPYALPVLLFSVCFNFLMGKRLLFDGVHYRGRLLMIAITVNLLILGYFKYTNFLIENINFIMSLLSLSGFQASDIELPIGISFFTFTQIVYLLDVYQGKTKEGSFRDYFLFVTFFPQLIAGPFLHHKAFIPQLSGGTENHFKYDAFFLGMFLFSIGLAKKILIADPLGEYADVLFDNVYTGEFNPLFFASWFGSLAYTFQIYFDFSGYSDMALGLGLLFGIRLPINFNSPYKAVSIIDFWQRWHMTLTSYIGQYLYTPLTLWFMRIFHGGSKAADWLGSVFLPNILVFFIIGIWHGASYTFVVWGLIHGVYLVVNHLWRTVKPDFWFFTLARFDHLRKCFSWMLTFGAVNLAFVMFRSRDLATAKEIYLGLLGVNGVSLPPPLSTYFDFNVPLIHWLQIDGGTSLAYIASLFIAFVLVLVPPNASRLINLLGQDNNSQLKTWLYGSYTRAIFLGVIFSLSLIGLNKIQTFLYFQF